MMQVPTLIENVWWRQKAWCEYGAKLFAFYSLKRHYRLCFNTSIPTALVSDEQRLVAVNPIWPIIPKDAQIRFLERGRAFHVAILRGFLSHEAGHVRFSGEKPSGLLGDVWNSLEDERIEILICQDHEELTATFTMLGDLFATQAHRSGDMCGETIEGVLYWRWCHDQAQPLWQAANEEQWRRVRLLVESAWKAPDSEEVTLIAKIILRVLEIPEDAPSDPRFVWLTASGGEGKATRASNKDGASDEPLPPTLEGDTRLEQLASILVEVEPYVRDLSEALKPPARRLTPQPMRSRGRFSFERYKAGSERIFRAKPIHVKRPLELCLCVDLSGSMGEADDMDSGLYAAQRLSVLLEQVCHLAGIPLTIIGFNHEAWLIREKTTTNDEALKPLAGLEASGGTQLAQGLELVGQTVKQRCICLVVCDGQLSEDDEAQCAKLVRASSSIDYIPILISDAEEAKDTYEQIFKRYLCVSDISELPKLVKAWLLARLIR
jgi:von Willebrand factor type A domain